MAEKKVLTPEEKAAETAKLKAYLDDKMTKAAAALKELDSYTQEQVDAICRVIAKAVFDNAEELARDAIDETRMGVYEDKVAKNRNKAKCIHYSLKGKKSVGIIEHDAVTGISKVAKPLGVVGAITPTTNPTVTCMSNAMFALKCRNPIIIAPHPRAMKVCVKTVEYINRELAKIGAPKDCVQILEIASIELTNMLARACDVIIATGGMDMVRSVYSSGKPALGVGAGNVQALVDSDVDLKDAIQKILVGRGFDNGIICTGEQSIHMPRAKYAEGMKILSELAFVVPKDKTADVRKVLFPDGKLNRELVGQSAQKIGEACGLTVPAGVKVIAVEADDIRDILGEEKMFPVITTYAYDSWSEAIANARDNLNKIGKGHSIAVHSKTRAHIEEAAVKCEVSRIVCNQTCATGGGGSFNNGLSPTNTLGCGSWGNNSISENLTYYHLMNVSRIAEFMADNKVPTDDEIWG